MSRKMAIRGEIANHMRRVRELRIELRDLHSKTKAEAVGLRWQGYTAPAIAEKLGETLAVIVAHLYVARVRKPGKRLYDYPPEQVSIYRKCRRAGISAQEARAAARME